MADDRLIRERYRERLTALLQDLLDTSPDPSSVAEAVLDELFEVTPVDGGAPCSCQCHPRLPSTDLHDAGASCPCQQTSDERQTAISAWLTEIDEYWRSPEGQAIKAQQEAEEAELHAWLAATADMTVTSHGGFAPEQWSGEIAGHRFYFRERHGCWRIELDLRPSGQTYQAFVGGDIGDDRSYVDRDVEAGDVIAKGVIDIPGYGTTPVERARFLHATVTSHLTRQSCQVHRTELNDLETLFGRPLNHCPACGERLFNEQPHDW